MSFPNHLDANSYEGEIDGISVRWKPQAITRLHDNSRSLGVDRAALKAATEHVAHACAKPLSKTGVKNTIAIVATGLTLPDKSHCTCTLLPGQVNAHIYVNLDEGLVALDDMKVLGEGVAKAGQSAPDPTLSTGKYTFP
ncbi:hypothetical protein AJ79_08463 [Helicocarpus griseus UAMH5409]|uniref:Uncharacterized protein n=1 Tax=Helicocarpus griseus UAMH5409 TaxID=1447875 RepID=A0A2B7WJQ5_9EURO|nr:hypothetical protein AJ79_08463 [Helicocarpus griseus UAMH5409]